MSVTRSISVYVLRNVKLNRDAHGLSSESDIIHLSALGNSIVVLNSAKMVSDLLDNRGSIYSSRPPAIMLGELMG